MRYIILVAGLLWDLMLIGFVAYLIYSNPKSTFPWLFGLFVFILWHQYGGFKHWRPENIKKFLRDAKKR